VLDAALAVYGQVRFVGLEEGAQGIRRPSVIEPVTHHHARAGLQVHHWPGA
jgi:hypothetical protein